MLRSPVVCILAHVDHGKTSILDKIRGTAVASKEAGGITQMIGAYYLPKEAIIASCGPLGPAAQKLTQVPGLLFIDTPGHEAFTSMRERGGSIADIAILVIDLMQGIQPQTLESLQILRANKTPFVIALNKVDLMQGWKKQDTPSITQSLKAQSPQVQTALEERLYTIVGKFSEMGLQSERYDRVSDFSKQLALVPCSAKTGEGMAELLMSIIGLSQKYLSDSLRSVVSGPGKGSIIEIKEEKGLGTTLEVILYDGTIKKNLQVVFGTAQGPRVVKVRGLLRLPLPGEQTAAGSKFVYMDEVNAAAGIKIYAPGMEGALAGSPIWVVEENNDAAQKVIEDEIANQIKSILFSNDTGLGVIIKSDTLGSAEAFVRLLQAAGVPIRSVSIGPVSKKDVLSAHSVALQDKYLGAIVVFNVPLADEVAQDAAARGIPIFSSNIIYHAFEQYIHWAAAQRQNDTQSALAASVLPVKVLVLPNCFFRLCKPAVFGIEVLEGRLRPGTPLMDANGNLIGEVKAIQDAGKSMDELKTKGRAAISMDEPYCGKTFQVGDLFYAYINKTQAAALRGPAAGALSEGEKRLLEEILGISGAVMI